MQILHIRFSHFDTRRDEDSMCQNEMSKLQGKLSEWLFPLENRFYQASKKQQKKDNRAQIQKNNTNDHIHHLLPNFFHSPSVASDKTTPEPSIKRINYSVRSSVSKGSSSIDYGAVSTFSS